MTIAVFLFRRRRALALCAVSAGLHVAALWWVVPRIDAVGARRQAPDFSRLPLTVPVRLLAAPALLQQPQQPLRKRARAPAASAASAISAISAISAASATSAASAVPAPAQAGAAEAASDVQSAASVEAEGLASAVPAGAAEPAEPPQLPVEPQPEPAVPAPPLARLYRVDLPPSASITLDVARTDADGTAWSGEAVMAWQFDGERYRMRVEAGVSMLVARINLVVLESEGRVGDSGFVPVTLTEKRRGRAPTTTRFSAGDGRITFSAAPAAALLPGAQDKATLPLQLAAIARGGSDQIADGIDVPVGEDRDASLYRFVVLGQEVLDTRLGKLQTWRLSRSPKAGAYSSRLDIWLAPGHGWYPVQIRNIEASGAVTTQTANKIILTQKGR